MMTEDQIRQALRDCYDPEMGLNVVDLGMVAKIQVRLDRDAPGAGIAGVPDRYAASVTLLAAEREESHEAQLLALVQNRLAGLPALSKVTVSVADTQVWTPALMTEAGRRMLRLDQPQFPILNNRLR